MFDQAGQRCRQRIDKLAAEAAGRPSLEIAQVEIEANDRKMRVQRGTNIDGTIENAHGVLLFLSVGESTGLGQTCVQVECRTSDENVQPESEHADRLALADLADR